MLNGVLEVVIGIVFIYVLVSIICTAIREVIEAKLKTRAAYLERGIRELLHDKQAVGLARNFFEHPLIYSLYSDTYVPGESTTKPRLLARGGNLPSYVPARNFALALMDIAARGPSTTAVSSHPSGGVLTLESVRMNIQNIQNPAVQRVLLTAIDSAHGDFDTAVKNIEAWFDSGMDRVSGWYKRSTGWVVFWIGLSVSVALNINTITIVDYLQSNDAARETIVQRAEAMTTDSVSYNQARTSLDSLRLPIGWSGGWGAPKRGDEAGSTGIWNNFLAPILGLLITALASSLGAPFWFDIMNRVMVIRATVKPHEKSREESSEDRQTKTKSTTIIAAPTPPASSGGAPSGPAVHAPIVRYSEPAPSPFDADARLDGCDVAVVAFTADEDLPEAEGGVA